MENEDGCLDGCFQRGCYWVLYPLIAIAMIYLYLRGKIK